jgi:ssDNA-binding Zn-finger/Zn-ribbon topoisomerase 1
MTKMVCDECGWCGDGDHVLNGFNPFDPDVAVEGCPQCKKIDSVSRACDEPWCRKQVVFGLLLPDGTYRCTCHDHKPEVVPA